MIKKIVQAHLLLYILQHNKSISFPNMSKRLYLTNNNKYGIISSEFCSNFTYTEREVLRFGLFKHYSDPGSAGVLCYYLAWRKKGHNEAIELSVSPGLELEAGRNYKQRALRKIKDRCFEFVASGDRYPFQLILSTRRADGARQGEKACILGPRNEACFTVLASASGVDERGEHYEVRIIKVPWDSLAEFCVKSGEHTDYICVAYDKVVTVNDPSEFVLEATGYSFRFVSLLQDGFKEI